MFLNPDELLKRTVLEEHLDGLQLATPNADARAACPVFLH